MFVLFMTLLMLNNFFLMTALYVESTNKCKMPLIPLPNAAPSSEQTLRPQEPRLWSAGRTQHQTGCKNKKKLKLKGAWRFSLHSCALLPGVPWYCGPVLQASSIKRGELPLL